MSIFTINANMPFLDTLAHGVLERYGDDPLVFSNITILLPSRRACRALQEAFLRARSGQPMLLPSILPLGDADDELLLFNSLEKLPERVISPTGQRLILTQLVEKWQSALKTDEKITTPQAAHLAIELAAFLAEVENQQLSFSDIEKIVPSELSKHWQITLQFLEILIEKWPDILKERDSISFNTNRNNMLNAKADYFKNKKQQYPVIAAGSTGSVPATANLLKTIANLPKGEVILPALDFHMDDDSWEKITETHPQYGLKQLLVYMEIARKDVNIWEYGGAEAVIDRSALMSEIMRPAADVDKWKNIDRNIYEQAKNVELVTAANMQQEAACISLMMKQTLQDPGKTAALITNNRDLAKHVASILQKWDVTVDDSAGQYLASCPQAVFLRLVAQVATDKAASPISLLSFLKHPFCLNGINSGAFRSNVRKLEKQTLRGIRKGRGLKSIAEDLQSVELKNWLASIEDVLKPFLDAMELKQVSFDEMIRCHLKAAQELAKDESGENKLWSGEAAEQLKEFFDELIDSARNFKEIDPTEYASLIEAMLAGQSFRPKYGSHPRLFILSPIEARMLRFDLVIAGGLNEGSWPDTGRADPWMSRPMRKDFGLPLPEKRIGQSAHDFVQCLSAPKVIITRAEKSEGMQGIPSRWILRMQAVLKLLGAEDYIKPKSPWAKWAEMINIPKQIKHIEPPCPTPATAARPTRLAATNIEKLMRDPYAIYASKILRLKKLDEIDKDAGAAEFGNFVHDALEKFVNDYDKLKEGEQLKYLLDVGKKLYDDLGYGATIFALWWPRYQRIADWFVTNEAKRRKEIKKIITERKGAYEFATKGGKFTLEARADRIEADGVGNITIVDYKTGTTARNKDVEAGLSPQMTLEALIADKGGFDIKGKTAAIQYWKLSGGKDVAEIKNIGKDLEELILEAEEGLKNIIEAFEKDDMPYLACPDPGDAPRYNDYEHLERIKEWG